MVKQGGDFVKAKFRRTSLVPDLTSTSLVARRRPV
jgi:hypothetical protein